MNKHMHTKNVADLTSSSFSSTTTPTWLLLMISILCMSSQPSHAQTTFIRSYCNVAYDAADLPAFYANLNATFADLRADLRPAVHFATAERARSSEPLYAIFQCRPYLPDQACAACLDNVSSLARSTCTLKRGSTTFSDGCFLRYDYANVFRAVTTPGQSGFCNDDAAGSVSSPAFDRAARGAVERVVGMVPGSEGMYAAGRAAVEGGGGAVYVAGQCMPTIGREDCRRCLESAMINVEGCVPNAGGRAVHYGCYLRFDGRPFFNDSQGVDLDRAAATDQAGSSSQKAAIIGGLVGAAAAALLLCILVLILFLRRRRRVPEWTWTGNIEGLTELQGPTVFTYNDLKSATRDFNDNNKLGQGGFSTVYKGVLGNGKICAVKKLQISETEAARTNFESEVTLISNIYHRNLVRLLGCCRKGPDLLLVYEYMEKSSLDRYLFGSTRGTLDWKQRFSIILGTARGLAYLHEEFHVRIIHRDIKPGNILLDDGFQPKIADFGLARLFPENRSHVSTRLAGTMGYAAPEYVVNGQLSEKVDTYSFGVVILETISGRRCNDLTTDDDVPIHLLERAWRLYESDSLLNLVEENLNVKAEEAKKVIQIGLMCTQSANLRPIMSDVVTLLMSMDHPRFQLSRPSFMSGNPTPNRTSAQNSTSSGSSMSHANVTISMLTGR